MHTHQFEHTVTGESSSQPIREPPSGPTNPISSRASPLQSVVESDASDFHVVVPQHRGQMAAHAASVSSARTRDRSRASSFCSCFSPTTSNSDTDDEDRPAQLSRNWNTSVTEVVRQQLALVGEATNQLAGPSISRRTMLNDEVTVHRIVEYSHHLVPDIDRILGSSYYWGVMDRFQAEQLLDGKPEGTFLLRDSAQTEYLFSVSFRRYQRTLHARIEQGNHRFSFDIHDQSVYSAPTVTKLIEKYKDPARCLFFEPQLTHPLYRSHVFSLQELCRGVIMTRTTYIGVASLRLPPKLKQFVRQYHYTVPVRTVNLQE
ncbi:hypothetical protein RB195_012777 [Necator americanus]|uniref:SH2 domain protein n=1 Tax=Necator americanus TaxID=51031 RepID=A0ABR1DSI8_NECAM